MKKLYEFFEVEYFQHDWNNIRQITSENDEAHGIFGDHKIRTKLAEIGFELFPTNESFASDTLTAVKIPAGLSTKDIISNLEKDHNVIISAGQGNLSDKILRIGHLGLVSDKEIDWLIESLIEVINK